MTTWQMCKDFQAGAEQARQTDLTVTRSVVEELDNSPLQYFFRYAPLSLKDFAKGPSFSYAYCFRSHGCMSESLSGQYYTKSQVCYITIVKFLFVYQFARVFCYFNHSKLTLTLIKVFKRVLYGFCVSGILITHISKHLNHITSLLSPIQM